MPIKQIVTKVLRAFLDLPHHKKVFWPVLFISAGFCCYLAIIARPTLFLYKGDTCVNRFTILPDSNKAATSEIFDIKLSNYLQIGNFRILSMRTCFMAKKAPQPGSYNLSSTIFGLLGQKTYILTVSQPPVLASTSLFSEPVSIIRPFKVILSGDDVFFGYSLKTDTNSTKCTKNDRDISCDLSKLALLQGTKYHVTLVRTFGEEEVGTLFDQTITTINATTLVSASIGQGETVYSKPKIFTFDFDRTITSASISLVKNEAEQVDSQVAYKDKQIVVSVKNDLERSTNYKILISNLVAIDGSTLETPYELAFQVSGGPEYLSKNVSDYGLNQSGTIILTFNQPILSSQNISDYISTRGATAWVSKTTDQVFVHYSGAAFCSDINIYIAPGLQSEFGIIQDKSSSIHTRTLCHTTGTIGYSVGGRPILDYVFGSGSQVILFTGNIHGYEKSTKYLMDYWVEELELNFANIPSNKKVIVVPTINPDGFANNTRNNLNGIDLNRNFETFDWQSNIYSPANQLIAGGGGSSPMSEPEALAIANLTIILRPRLTMSFHGSASYAIGNQAGDSAGLAATYSKLTGYRNMTGVSGAFSYPITGTYDDWMRDQYGLTSVLIELGSNSSSEFSRNKAALWEMVKS